VLLDEVVATIAPADGEVYLDCTLGGGGHSGAILERARCRVIGIDRDPAALAAARAALARFGDRFVAVHGRFSELGSVLRDLGVDRVHGILADFGVSSPQLDDPARGFSFARSGPIDMRMDPTTDRSAADLVNGWDEDALAEVIARYGEERRARRVARVIVEGRPWTDVAVLGAAVARAVGGGHRIHPATRTFQALRIAVNDELGEIERLLPQIVDHLHPGGRVAIVSFHSLEDRLVKRFLDQQAGKGRPRDPFGNPIGPVRLRVLPDLTPAEDDPNPRARSARLRRAVRSVELVPVESVRSP